MSVHNEPNPSSLTTTQPDDFLDYAMAHDFGDLHFKVDKKTGMKAIVAIHSTKLGPALGDAVLSSTPIHKVLYMMP